MKRTEKAATRYQTFEDLEVYQVAREFRKAMYSVAKQLPETEKFGLSSQIRRAARVQESPSRDDFSEDELSDLFFGRFNSSSL